MTRILILGAAPLPFEPRQRQYAANLRTWHLTQPLLAAGHEIRLVACRVAESYPPDVEPVLVTRPYEGLEYHSITAELFHEPSYLQELADAFAPQAIVGVNTYPASRAVQIETASPIWCDLNGWIMAEAQTKAYVYDDDRYLSHFWNMERDILDRGDVFSAVSEAQAHATVGELAARGRLSRTNLGYPFVHRIPNAVSEIEYAHSKTVIRGSVATDDDFVVLWAGGYNTWTDVDLLFSALTAAMAEVTSLRFVSTGGALEGHDDVTFERFRKLARQSPFAERFHFAGWVPTEDVPCYYFESDLGLNVDNSNYETVFGARNRLNDMMKAGLAVLTTTGTEISRILGEKELALTCETGDAAAFAERLIWATQHRDELHAMANAGQSFAQEEFSYARTTEPLRRWAEAPQRAPDAGQGVVFQNIDFFTQPEPAPPLTVEPGEVPDIERQRVCAVIPHHRGAAMLERCLKSLLASLAVDLQIVVVENHCLEELPPIATTSPRVHSVVTETSLGFSAANNLGVDWAREHLGEHDFYYFVNNDTESTPEALARLIGALEARPTAAMAGPTLLILDADDHYNSLGINVTEDGWGWDEAIGQSVEEYGPPPALRPVLTVTGSALLIEAELYHQIGGWTEIYEYYFEDIDLGIKTWKAEREVIHVPEAVVRHQISATMTDGSARKDFLFWRNRLLLAVIHWPSDLLRATLKRAVHEVLDRRRVNRPVLRRALFETLARLPSLWRHRRQWRGDTTWRRFLVPPGSTPVITLPAMNPSGEPEEETAARSREDSPTAAPSVTGAPTQAAFEHLHRALEDSRREVDKERRRAERYAADYTETMRVLDQIHASKVWRLWTASIRFRKWLRNPLKRSRES